MSISKNLTDIVILRHGEAGSASSDRERRLTKLGQSQITEQCQWLKNNAFAPEKIIHSPYVRTTETAELANEIYPDAELLCESLITPDADPLTAASFIGSLTMNRILIVSHMPMVAYLTKLLLTDSDIFAYPEAGLCWLRYSKVDEQLTLLHKEWIE